MALRKKGNTDADFVMSSVSYPAVSDEIAQVMTILPSASIVVAHDGTILRASTRALTLGVVQRNAISVSEIDELIKRVIRENSAREQALRIRRPPLGRDLLEVLVRVAPLNAESVLVIVDDLGEGRRVDAVRRDFVANVSHELKTPVGALSLLAEAVLASADDRQQVEHFAQKMQVEARRLTSLVQDVIDLSRLQGDDPMIRAEVVDTDELINRAIDEVRTLATELGSEIVRGSEKTSTILGDRGQLLTAVRNLLSNAVIYSGANTRVSVTSREVDGIIEIAVKDAGIGIPAHDMDRIFERFYRVDPARSRETGGTGLGLAIVKHVCQNHGGECVVWSEVGTGSTFTLRLPSFDSMVDHRPASGQHIEQGTIQ